MVRQRGRTGGERPIRRTPYGAVKRAQRLRKTMTANERRLWSALRKLNLNIRRQAPIGPFIVDFAQLTARVVVEIDGAHWHSTVQARAMDARRDEWLTAQHFRVLRIPDEVVTSDLGGIVTKVGSLIQKRLNWLAMRSEQHA